MLSAIERICRVVAIPAGVRVCPDSPPLSRLQTFNSLGSGNLKVGPCRSHEVVVPSRPDDVRIRSISLLEWV